MKEPPSINRFLARHFPVFMGTIFMAIFSGSAVVSMAGVTCLRGVDCTLSAVGVTAAQQQTPPRNAQKLSEIRHLRQAAIAKRKAR